MPRRFDPGIEFEPGGGVRSRRFDDIYHQPGHGPEEKRAVFLAGCGLPDAWRGRERFTVGETGFGTGLNFLLTWEAWRATASERQRLHYVAVEGCPLTPAELHRALSLWPALAPLAGRLERRYGTLTRGFERLHFDRDRVTLTLLVGEAHSVLEQLEGTVDAWYLDGFAPRRNPAMWSEGVFAQIARLSATGAGLATYTTAGSVRRGLAAAGFELATAPGFGPKRERLIGRYRGRPRSLCPPWAKPPPALGADRPVTVLGGGVGGRALAQALARRSPGVLLIDCGGGASLNPAALVMPRLEAGGGLAGRLFWAAYRYALRHWQATTHWRGDGALLLARDDAEQDRQRRIVEHWGMDAGDARVVDAAETAELTGVDLANGGLWFAGAGRVDGAAAINEPVSGAGVVKARVAALREHDVGWQPLDSRGRPLAEPASLVLATGAQLELAPTAALPLSRWGGRATVVEAGAASARLQANLVCGRYLTAATPGAGGSCRHWTGAGFVPQERSGPIAAGSDEDNLRALARAIPELAELRSRPIADGWQGVRCASPDRLPVVGPLVPPAAFISRFGWLRHGARPPAGQTGGPSAPTGLHGFLALGARGFTSAPLLGEWLASMLLGDPWPLERDLALAVHASRFLVRGLRRRKL